MTDRRQALKPLKSLAACILRAPKIPRPVAAAVPAVADLDFSVGEKTLQGVLAACADEIKAITEALLS